MIDYITEILKENTIAQGGLVVAMFSALLIQLRQVPAFVSMVWKRNFTSFIKLDQKQPPMRWMLSWLSETDYGKNTKHVTVHNGSEITVGPGKHYFFRSGRLIIIRYTREHMETGGIPMGIKQELSVRVIPGKRQVIEDLLIEAENVYKAEEKESVKIIRTRWGGWNSNMLVPKRAVDSVILSNDNEKRLISSLERFKNNKDKCLKYQIPWRLGLLLYGEPGNGKTSLATAIASFMDYNVYILNINAIPNDEKLLELCSDIKDESIILIEDIDAYNVKREDKDTDSISLSGLLNALDGLTTQNGVVTIMTTNCPNSLDPALIRKGRADLHLELSTPTTDQIERLFKRFDVEYNGESFENMASAQYHLLEKI